MGLNKSKGNMYRFVTHTWNTIKGQCYHNCSYCYINSFCKQKPVYFDDEELKTDLGSGNTIFVGSSNDMFCENYAREWIYDTLNHCKKYINGYLFQTKNPIKLARSEGSMPDMSKYCFTIETNRYYSEFMGNAPKPYDRLMKIMYRFKNPMITIEPIMDFDLIEFVALLKKCEPYQINIGADICGHNLPEPSKEKTLEFIEELKKFTNVYLKSNLGRIIK